MSSTSAVRPPSQPVNVVARGADSLIKLAWDPPVGATSYNLYWNMTGGVTASSNRVLNVSMPFSHLDRTNGTTYYYRVSAMNVAGESALSVEVRATPLLPFTKILTKLMDPDAEQGDQFGYSVDIDGDYAIVGAWQSSGLDPNNPIPYAGAAYIFHRSGTGIWDPAGAKLMAPDASSWDLFGYSVSISGDYAIVSAKHKDAVGAAYIFHRIGVNTWDAGTKIVGPDPAASLKFGSAVSISGDYAVVGDEEQGRVFVFHRTDTNTWDSGTPLPMPPDTDVTDRFGYAVAISGDYVIVGAWGEDSDASNSLPQAGAAYIFHRIEDSWAQFSKIMPHDGAEGDCFGISVAISGDYAVVGAVQQDDDSGAVYVFHRLDENFWDEGPKLVAPDAQAGDSFGLSVAITDKYVLVGAYAEDCGWDENHGEGAAYIYERIGSNSWDGGTKITIPQGDPGDGFGFAVAISGESAIIAAIGDDCDEVNEVPEAGAVYLY
jgi:hypothetical protein